MPTNPPNNDGPPEKTSSETKPQRKTLRPEMMARIREMGRQMDLRKAREAALAKAPVPPRVM